MGDISNETPLTTGLGSSNNVFQEQIKDGNESPLDNASVTTATTPLVRLPNQENLLLNQIDVQNNGSSDSDIILDVESVSLSTSRKRSKRISKSHLKKDKCPCQTSDTTSWKPKCCKCHQTWHSACCNLRGISSITELENWECPWCYLPLFSDPSKPKVVTNVLKEIQIDINSIQNKCDNFNVSELQNEIDNLKLSLSQFSVSNQNHDNVNKIHDGILSSINFELQKIVSGQNSFVTNELAKLKGKNSIISSSESMAPPSTAFCFPGKHFDHHQSSFLAEDCKDGLKVFVTQNDEEFVKVGSREVLYYGEFSYKYSNVEHKAAPLPDAIQQVVDRIHQNFPSSEKVNSCLITKYTDGSSTCPPHSDDEPFISPASDIFTLSMGAERTMKFNNCSKHTNVLDDSIALKDNDLLVFSRVSQDFFNHSIVPDETSNLTRYSFTFRSLAPYNLNFTKIIGDSNTKELVFGPDRGRLGKWMPGSLIKASKIANIPDAFEIGPCRNIVIHVGINDVQVTNPKSPTFLSKLLDDKIQSILSVYPKMRIFLSLLLPTKDSNLNFKVNELNKCLKQLAANHNNVDIIEHYNLVDQNGFLNPSLGRFKKGLPNTNDLIHLGNNGIKRFVLNIKNKIMHKTSSQARTQPSFTRANQSPLPTSTVPWQHWSSPHPQTDSSSSPPLTQPPSQPPAFVRPPVPSSFSLPASGSGYHQNSNTMYQSLYPSLAYDGYQC